MDCLLLALSPKCHELLTACLVPKDSLIVWQKFSGWQLDLEFRIVSNSVTM